MIEELWPYVEQIRQADRPRSGFADDDLSDFDVHADCEMESRKNDVLALVVGKIRGFHATERGLGCDFPGRRLRNCGQRAFSSAR